MRYPLIGNWVTHNTAHPDPPRPGSHQARGRHPHPRQMPELQVVEFCGRPVGLDTPSTSRASGIRTYNPTGGRPHLHSPASPPRLRRQPATAPALNQKQPGATQLPRARCASGILEATEEPRICRDRHSDATCHPEARWHLRHPDEASAKLSPEITVASLTRRTQESLTVANHRSLPNPNRPAEGPLLQPSLSLNLIQPQFNPHPQHSVPTPSPHPAMASYPLSLTSPSLLCISSSPTELSLYLTQPGTPVSHPAHFHPLYLIQPGRRP